MSKPKREHWRRTKFKRAAERRTKAVLEAIRLVGNCGNRVSYKYTEEEAEKIFSAISKGISDAKKCFDGGDEFTL